MVLVSVILFVIALAWTFGLYILFCLLKTFHEDPEYNERKFRFLKAHLEKKLKNLERDNDRSPNWRDAD